MFKNQFGVTEFYPTAIYGSVSVINNPNLPSGWQYFSNYWDMDLMREFQPDNNIFLNDIFMHFKKVEGSYCIVRGDGRITIGSENPVPLELSIYDEDNLNAGILNANDLKRGLRWTNNIEFTIYFNRKLQTDSKPIEMKGYFEIHLGSDHHFGSNTKCPFNAHDYSLVIKNDGRMYFSGEPYHTIQRDPRPDGINEVDFWGTNFTGIPLDQTIGIKFIKRVINTNEVFLEVYRDLSDGFNGGDWHKLFEFKHVQGNWTTTDMDTAYQVSLTNASDYCVIPPPRNVDEPHANMGGGLCYIKMTPVKEIDLKWVSCRDIEPDPHPPVTTTTYLTATGSSTDGDTTGF